MATVAEIIEEAKRCCREKFYRKVERNFDVYDKLFDSDWEVFVVKYDKSAGKFTGTVACCALSLIETLPAFYCNK